MVEEKLRHSHDEEYYSFDWKWVTDWGGEEIWAFRRTGPNLNVSTYSCRAKRHYKP